MIDTPPILMPFSHYAFAAAFRRRRYYFFFRCRHYFTLSIDAAFRFSPHFLRVFFAFRHDFATRFRCHALRCAMIC